MLKQRSQSHKRKNSELQLYHPFQQKQKSNTQNNNKSKKKSDIKHNNQQKSKNGKSKNLELDDHNRNNRNDRNNPLRLNLRQQNYQNSNNNNNKFVNRQNNIAMLVSNSQRKFKEKFTVVQNIEEGENGFDFTNDQNFDTSNQNQNQNINQKVHKFNKNIQKAIQGADLTLTHLTHSSNKMINKDNKQNNGMFCFGKKNNYLCRKPFNNIYEGQQLLQMEQIVQVPDTMSCQRRYNNKNSDRKYQSLKDGLVQEQDSRQNRNFQNEKQQNSFDRFKKNYKLQSKFIDQSSQLKINQNDEDDQKQQKISGSGILVNNLAQNYKKTSKKSKKSAQHKRKCLQNYKTNSTICLSQQKSRNNSQKHKNSLNNRNGYGNDSSCIGSMKSKSIQILKPTSSCQKQKQVKTIKTGTKQEIRSLSIDQLQKQKQKRFQILQQNNQKMNKQVKMLWQCMGQLWQSNRIARYITQRNKLNIQKILKKEQTFDSNLINMKAQIIRSIGSSRY